MNSRELNEFERCALASGLLVQEELDEARVAIRWSVGDQPDADGPPTAEQLADKLVESGRLNSWQAKQLLEGRTRFTLGPYKIVDGLGQGGMGQVFKAEHGVLGRVVAIKVLPLNRSTPEAVENFTREIRAQARLDHPNLVRALDAGHDGNVYYLVSEYIPGGNLRRLVRRHGPLSMETAASIIAQVAAGLDHAHQQGLVHRDVKPGNVLVTPDGVAKLSDLGLAGSLGGDLDDPRFGKVVGTADYLSPDHIKEPFNPMPAWDIYSLGCTLYYAVTGKVPFLGGTTADKVRAHCELRPLDPRRLNPELTLAFVDVIADMMAKNPAERITAAAEVVERLSPWVGPPRPVQPAEGARDGVLHPALPSAAAGQIRAEAIHMADTATSLPEIPLDPSPRRLARKKISLPDWNTEIPFDPSICVQLPKRPISILRPLMVMVVLPLLLMAAMGGLWWLLRFLF